MARPKKNSLLRKNRTPPHHAFALFGAILCNFLDCASEQPAAPVIGPAREDPACTQCKDMKKCAKRLHSIELSKLACSPCGH